MPTRVKLSIAFFGVVVFAALVVLFVSRPTPRPIGVSSPAPEAQQVRANAPAPIPPPVVSDTELALREELSTLADTLKVGLPATSNDLTLTSVSTERAQLKFFYAIDIDMGEYVLGLPFPSDLDVGLCYDYICVQFSDEFLTTQCNDPNLAVVIDQGAVLWYYCRDNTGQTVATASVSNRDGSGWHQCA